ncbi:MAG: DNA repair protein RecN [Bacteroidetes bacterium]|nr:MAG: DNA repair protein RecN [Bacteroidota bacterium]
MLKKIIIKNYALIKELDLSFDLGLQIITGETGAGKSIIIGALGLILGNRADVSVLNDKSQKCVVEATFDMDIQLLSDSLKNNDIDIEDSLIIRRQINPQGKSRAFINDTPVKLPVLRELSARLIDVNSQHQTYSLNDSKSQLQLLDNYAGLTKRLIKYRKDYLIYKGLTKELDEIESKERKAKAEKDFLQFQFDELEKANLVEGEQQSIEDDLQVLNHAEEIKSHLYEADNNLQFDDNSVLNSLSSILSSIQSISSYHDDYNTLSKRLDIVFIELQDIAQEIESLKENVDFDPLRLEELNQRNDLLNRLLQKHIVNSVEELITLKEEIENKLLSFEKIDEDKSSLQKKITVLFDDLVKQADEIHEKRKKVIPEVQKEVEKSLASLGMKSAQFVVELEKMEQLSVTGRNKLQFLFSANRGMEVGPISKIASGGELSRLMLTLKNVLTAKKSLATMIFDEIDTGVSGDIANMVGNMMKSMGEKMQIIAITHLPQIAGKANSHYKVYKQEDEEHTYSSIKKLNNEERIEELSLMISGTVGSKAATATARELMN